MYNYYMTQADVNIFHKVKEFWSKDLWVSCFVEQSHKVLCRSLSALAEANFALH